MEEPIKELRTSFFLPKAQPLHMILGHRCSASRPLFRSPLDTGTKGVIVTLSQQ
jgi:hypothetical protein